MAIDVIATPVMNFNFRLELNGLSRFLIQEVEMPDAEVTEIKHGAPGNRPDGKSPGKPKFGDIVLRKIKPEVITDKWAWDWMALVINSPRAAYVRHGILAELDPSNLATINEYYIAEVWPKMIGNSTYTSEGDGDKLIEEVTLSCRYYYHTRSAGFASLFTKV